MRNLIRRFVEVGVPGYHIEDQKPGSKKCGHQGGKVLVAVDEQIKRLNAARFQLDIMGVPGIIVARTDAEAATLLDGRSDERDQPFILGATNIDLPSLQGRLSWRSCSVCTNGRRGAQRPPALRGCRTRSTPRRAWLEGAGLGSAIGEAAGDLLRGGAADRRAARRVDRRTRHLAGEAGLKTYGEAVAERHRLSAGREGER